MIHCNNEWGKLRETFVGTIDNANMPTYGIDLHAINYDDKKVIPFQDESWSCKIVLVKENDVIVMPSWYLHRTQENKSKNVRFMIATNIGIKIKKKLL